MRTKLAAILNINYINNLNFPSFFQNVRHSHKLFNVKLHGLA